MSKIPVSSKPLILNNNDLDNFKNTSDVIIANRFDEEIADEKDKIYTRDIFRNN